jgi:hypothetical protein
VNITLKVKTTEDDSVLINSAVKSTVYVKRTLSGDKSTFFFMVLTAALSQAGGLFVLFSAFSDVIKLRDIIGGLITGLFIIVSFNTVKYFSDKNGGDRNIPAVLSLIAAVFSTGIIFLFKNECAEAILGLTESFFNTLGRNFAFSGVINRNALAESSVYLVVCGSAISAVALFYIISVKKSKAALFVLTCVPPIFLMCSGIFPNMFALFALISSVIAVAAYGYSDKIYTGFFALGSAAICIAAAYFGVTYALMPSLDSNNFTERKDITVNEILSGFGESQKVLPASYSTGAIRHGELGKVGNIKFSGDTVLRAEFPKSTNTIYLRGFIAAEYYDNKWYELSGTPRERERQIASQFSDSTVSPLLMDGANITGELPLSFSVSDLTENKEYDYLPYTITPDSGKYLLSGDKTRFNFYKSSYSGKFYGAADSEVYRRVFEFNRLLPDGDRADDEALYRDFVYENYLEVPENFTGGELVLTNEFDAFVGVNSETENDLDSQMDILSRKLYYIRNYLRENCSYNLSVGKVPEGEDFVNRFLEVTKAGSCSHFASAAALLCRSAGIPARYVEGYVIKPKDFPADVENGELSTVSVADTRAHAWVEIYIDEFGWYPYEFTSGYGNVRTAVTEPMPDETTAAVTAPPVSESLSPESTAPETLSPQVTETPDLPEEVIALPEKGAERFLPLLWLLIPAAFAVIPLRRHLILKKRVRFEEKLSPSETVFRAFGEMLPIFSRFSVDVMSLYTDYNGFMEKLGESECSAAAVIAKTAALTAFAGYKPDERDKAEVLAALKEMKTKYYDSFSKRSRFIKKYFRVYL